MRTDVIKLISAIRNSHPDIKQLYMNGQCYNFCLILRAAYPKAEIWYDQVEGHAYTKIGRYWYDIRGEHLKVSKTCLPLDHRQGHRPHRWGLGDNRRLVLTCRLIESKHE